MTQREKKVVLAGAGTMGASLAQVYAQAGWETVLYNRSTSGLERTTNLIAINHETFVRAQLLENAESEKVMARIQMPTDRQPFPDAPLEGENLALYLDVNRAL